MKKRALAAVLWSATGWYVGAMVAWVLNIGPILPVVFGAAAAVLVAGDPFHIIWNATPTAPDAEPRSTAGQDVAGIRFHSPGVDQASGGSPGR